MYVHCGQFGSPEKKSIITKELNKIEIWIELMRYMGETEADNPVLATVYGRFCCQDFQIALNYT